MNTKITDQQKQNALNAGKDAMEATYQKAKRTTLKWWERLLWIILAGIAAAATSLLTGCGHNLTITPDHTEICKNGTCLILDKNTQTITYRQNAPAPPAPHTPPPVIVQKGK